MPPAYSPRLESVADGRHQEVASRVEVGLRGWDRAEDPAREQLLDGAVEGHRGEHRLDVATQSAAPLPLLDDPGDPLVGAADLLEVSLAKRVRRPRHLDDDHLHQLRVVPVGVEDEAGDLAELLARTAIGLIGL